MSNRDMSVFNIDYADNMRSNLQVLGTNKTTGQVKSFLDGIEKVIKDTLYKTSGSYMNMGSRSGMSFAVSNDYYDDVKKAVEAYIMNYELAVDKIKNKGEISPAGSTSLASITDAPGAKVFTNSVANIIGKSNVDAFLQKIAQLGGSAGKPRHVGASAYSIAYSVPNRLLPTASGGMQYAGSMLNLEAVNLNRAAQKHLQQGESESKAMLDAALAQDALEQKDKIAADVESSKKFSRMETLWDRLLGGAVQRGYDTLTNNRNVLAQERREKERRLRVARHQDVGWVDQDLVGAGEALEYEHMYANSPEGQVEKDLLKKRRDEEYWKKDREVQYLEQQDWLPKPEKNKKGSLSEEKDRADFFRSVALSLGTITGILRLIQGITSKILNNAMSASRTGMGTGVGAAEVTKLESAVQAGGGSASNATGALEFLTKSFRNVNNLNASALEQLALVVPGIENFVGSQDTMGMLGTVMDSLYSRYKSGTDVIGESVAPEVALASLIQHLQGVSPDLAEVFKSYVKERDARSDISDFSSFAGMYKPKKVEEAAETARINAEKKQKFYTDRDNFIRGGFYDYKKPYGMYNRGDRGGGEYVPPVSKINKLFKSLGIDQTFDSINSAEDLQGIIDSVQGMNFRKGSIKARQRSNLLDLLQKALPSFSDKGSSTSMLPGSFGSTLEDTTLGSLPLGNMASTIYNDNTSTINNTPGYGFGDGTITINVLKDGVPVASTQYAPNSDAYINIG